MKFKNSFPGISDFLLKLKRGSDEAIREEEIKLVESILAKSPESDFRQTSINKFFKEFLKFIDPVISDQRLWKILREVDINPIQEVHVIRKQLSQSSIAVLETRGGIGLPIPVQVTRAQISNKDAFEVKSAPTFNPRLDKIRFVKPSELPLWVYIMDERVIRTPETSKLIKKLRGGSLIETAGALILIVVMWQIMGVGIDGFQLPIVHPNGRVHRPANGGVQQYMNHPFSGS